MTEDTAGTTRVEKPEPDPDAFPTTFRPKWGNGDESWLVFVFLLALIAMGVFSYLVWQNLSSVPTNRTDDTAAPAFLSFLVLLLVAVEAALVDRILRWRAIQAKYMRKEYSKYLFLATPEILALAEEAVAGGAWTSQVPSENRKKKIQFPALTLTPTKDRRVFEYAPGMQVRTHAHGAPARAHQAAVAVDDA